MLKNIMQRMTCLFIIFLIVLTMPFSSYANELEPVLAPLNPEFEEYINNSSFSKMSISTNGKGFVPEPYVINTSIHADFSEVYEITYPSRFDLRDINKVTSVKNQGQSGSCWTFAAYSSLESYLMPDEEWDFSEKNLRNNHGFDNGPDDGGNRGMSTAYMARWDGPVLESDDPYDDYGYYSPKGLPIQKHLTNVFYIPNRTDPTDNELIKYALTEYGAVQSSIYSDDYYHNTSTNGYYYYGSKPTNHAISIVGWDDDYSRDNFRNTPPGDGAFIVKNSWGSHWGENGYFYVSYYDTLIGTNNAVFVAQDKGMYDNIYQYDTYGMTGASGYGTGTGWFANVFNSGKKDENLNGVGFYLQSDNSNYEIFVITDFNGNWNERAAVKSGEAQFAGYYTVNFAPILIKANTQFAVIMKVVSSKDAFQIPLEGRIAGYTSNATAQNGQSYMGSSGKSWIDVLEYYPNTNVALKAFTKDVPQDPYEDYMLWEEILTTKSQNHSWTVEFNAPVDEETVNSSSIYIIDSNNNKLNFITPEVVNEGNLGYVLLTNNGLFEINKDYRIVIENSIKSKNQISLTNGIVINFNVQE